MSRKLMLLCAVLLLVGGGVAIGAEENLGATPQLLANVGFERGDGERAADWGLWPPHGATPGVSSLRDANVHHSGQYSGRLRITAPDFAGICTWHHPAVPVVAGQELVLQFWVKAENVVDRAGCDVQLRQGPDKIVGSAGMANVKGSFDWKLMTHRLVVPEGADHLCVVPLLYGNGTVWCDDFRLYGTPSANVPRAAAPPRVDGDGSDACWAGAATLEGFALNEGAGSPERRTSVKALCDSQTLYFLFDCEKQPGDKLRATVKQRDGVVWSDDEIEVFVNPRGNFGDYYQFIVNPLGTRYDSHGTDASWNADWQVATRQTPQHWVVEIALPIRSFALDLTVGRDWCVNVGRGDKLASQASSWSAAFGGFHNPGRFGRLLGLDLDLLPYYQQDARTRTVAVRQAYEATVAGLDLTHAPTAVAAPVQERMPAITAALARLEKLLADPKGATPQDWAQVRPVAAQLTADIEALRAASLRLRAWSTWREPGAAEPRFGLATAPAMVKVRRDGQDFGGEVSRELNLSAARNEYESGQIVVVSLSGEELTGCRASISPLTGPNGATLGPECLQLSLVGYITTAKPGYETAYVGDWPDPILPLQPFTVAAGQVQPLWLRAYVPPGTRPGLYRGAVTVSAGVQDKRMAVQLRVFDFELPRRQHLATPFGCAPGTLSQWYTGSSDYMTHMPPEVWKRWNRFLLDYRITPTHVARAYVKEVRRPDGSVQYDYSVTDDCMRDVLDRLPADGVAVAGIGDIGWMVNRGATCQPVDTDAHTGRRSGRVSWPKTDSWAALDHAMDGRLLAERGCRAFRFWVKALDPADAGEEIVAFVNCFPNRWVTTFKVGGTDWHEVRIPVEQYHHNTTGAKLDLAGLRTCNDFQFVISKKSRAVSYLLDDIVAECDGGAVVLDDFEAESEVRHMRESLGQQIRHFRDRGWLQWGHVYAKDEIQPVEYAQVLPRYRQALQAVPDARLMQTYYVNRTPQELVGLIKIWCAITSIYDEDFLSARRRAGEKTWLYVCCGPHPPYANFFIDQPGVDHRVLFWQAWQRHCTGLLYWETDYWHGMMPPTAEEPRWPAEPWDQTKVATYREFKVNGDGFLIYPGPDWTPWPSVRLENIRDGIEDYEYLCLLRERAPQSKLLTVGEDISRDFTHFTKDPRVLQERRRQIAAALESGRRP
ncbi:DUF4091 domain-containing protein [bacterium]|nr:DUF4091 domain-containing protein [bacterium]